MALVSMIRGLAGMALLVMALAACNNGPAGTGSPGTPAVTNPAVPDESGRNFPRPPRASGG